jgi:hypothetical protein
VTKITKTTHPDSTVHITVAIDQELLPKSKAHQAALFWGALAWKEGKKLHQNPYSSTWRARSFENAWNLGWSLAAKGQVTFS